MSGECIGRRAELVGEPLLALNEGVSGLFGVTETVPGVRREGLLIKVITCLLRVNISDF